MSTLMTKVIEVALGCQEKLAALGRDESGASAIEYALIVGVVVGALAAVMAGFSDDITAIFESMQEEVSGAADEASGDSGG